MSSLGQNINDLKYKNRARILEIIFYKGPHSRKAIASLLGLTPAAITNITGSLIEESILVESQKVGRKSSAGRKEQLLELNYTKFKFLSVLVERKGLYLKITDLEGKSILEVDMMPLNRSENIEEELFEKIDKLIKDGSIEMTEINSAGISFSEDSFLDIKKCELLKDEFKEKYEFPVYLEKQTSAMIFADNILRKEKSFDRRLLLRFDSFLYGSLYDNKTEAHNPFISSLEWGNLIIKGGDGGFVAEKTTLAHIYKTVTEKFSASTFPVLFELTRGDKSKINIKLIFQAYESGDRGLTEILDSVAHKLAFAISDCVNVLMPEKVLLCSAFLSSNLFTQKLSSALRLSNSVTKPEFLLIPNYSKLLNFSATAVALNGFLESGAFIT